MSVISLSEKVRTNNLKYNKDFKGGLNPIEWINKNPPSWWRIVETDCGQHDCPYPYPHTSCARTCIGEPYASGYQQQHWTKEEALEFSRLVMKLSEDKNAWIRYQCQQDSYYCQFLKGGSFSKFAIQLEKEIQAAHLLNLKKNEMWN